MADIKQKPKMDKPKAIARQGNFVKDARRMLMQEYQKSGPGVKAREEGQPVCGAVEQMEHGAKDSARMAARTTKAGMRAAKQKMQDAKTGAGGRRTASDGSVSQHPTAASRHPDAAKGQARRQRVQKEIQQKNKIIRKDTPPMPGQKAAPGLSSKGVQAANRPAGSGAHHSRKRRSLFSAGKNKVQAKARTTAKRKRRAQKAAMAAKKAGKATGKLAARAGKALIRAGAALAKGVAALAAACTPVLVVIIIAGAAAALIASPFGLFFSKEDKSPEVSPVSQVVQRVSADFNRKIQAIRDNNTWDTLKIHTLGAGRGSNWREVLAIFAVKTTLFDEDATDVVTIDEKRAGLIEGIFWDMNKIRHWMEMVEHIEKTMEFDGLGNMTEVDVITYEYILHIEITSASAAQQADTYGFNADQRDVLQELVSGAYDDLFTELIGSGIEIGDGSGVVAVGIYAWPSAASKHVSSPFGDRTHPITGEPDFHYGIDISAGAGTGILAAADGKVVTAQYHWSYGNYLVIDHGGDNTTLYAHCSVLLAGAGQTVSQGQLIALVGSTGTSSGPHLHFETHAGGARVDPLRYFSGYS